ncbi:Oidioi.mRNA.OKI2018_I69.YSR.g17206.t1.cds [Oikopleura dioica]|uniref:Oidioi.mRNA.OKI2018_I69.YSR.g17206.t1.cds n=1 Tax=Oikopleura dioica TaxID=34765 RepID=A0ABN7SNN1_OIKDI|nr:Oidioi.mRNA.OKI2018_I69.YSR.g17206.t1.cds [Oikopleura dioica]
MRLFGNKREKGVVGYFAGHADGIAYIYTAHDGRTVLTSAKDQAIKLWDIRMFTRPEATEKFTSQIADDYWDYRHDYVPTRHQNTVVEVDEEDTSVLTFKGHILLFSPPGVVGYFAGHADGIAYIYTAHDGRTVLTSAKDQAIKLWDIRMFTRPEATEKFTSQIADDYWDYRHDYVPTGHQNTVVEVDEEDTSVLTFKGHILLFSPPVRKNKTIF